jgi:hypothetical protein
VNFPVESGKVLLVNMRSGDNKMNRGEFALTFLIKTEGFSGHFKSHGKAEDHY